jgi:hypothetical protein
MTPEEALEHNWFKQLKQLQFLEDANLLAEGSDR